MDWRMSEALEVLPKEKLKEAAFISTKVVVTLLHILGSREGAKASEVGVAIAGLMEERNMPEEAKMLRCVALRLRGEGM